MGDVCPEGWSTDIFLLYDLPLVHVEPCSIHSTWFYVLLWLSCAFSLCSTLICFLFAFQTWMPLQFISAIFSLVAVAVPCMLILNLPFAANVGIFGLTVPILLIEIPSWYSIFKRYMLKFSKRFCLLNASQEFTSHLQGICVALAEAIIFLFLFASVTCYMIYLTQYPKIVRTPGHVPFIPTSLVLGYVLNGIGATGGFSLMYLQVRAMTRMLRKVLQLFTSHNKATHPTAKHCKLLLTRYTRLMFLFGGSILVAAIFVAGCAFIIPSYTMAAVPLMSLNYAFLHVVIASLIGQRERTHPTQPHPKREQDLPGGDPDIDGVSVRDFRFPSSLNHDINVSNDINNDSNNDDRIPPLAVNDDIKKDSNNDDLIPPVCMYDINQDSNNDDQIPPLYISSRRTSLNRSARAIYTPQNSYNDSAKQDNDSAQADTNSPK